MAVFVISLFLIRHAQSGKPSSCDLVRIPPKCMQLPRVLLENGDHRVVGVDALRDGGGAGLGVGPVPVPVVVASVRTVPPVPSSSTATSARAIAT